MTSSQHMLVVIGARPQFIKAAALNRALRTTLDGAPRGCTLGNTTTRL